MIISLNEEANIGRCIASVPFADDIVVVDSFSHDRTKEIAESFGAKVHLEKWHGFCEQKVLATRLAKNNWIISLDADEALSRNAQVEILELINRGMKGNEVELDADGYRLPRLSFHMGQWIRHGGWYPDYQLRFFNRKKAEWRAGHLHERVYANRVETLKGEILHWPFSDIADQVQTNNRYSGLGAQDLFDKAKKFGYFKLVFKPISKFVETYFIKLGLLDGFAGFVISVGAAYSVFLKFAKLRELESATSKKNAEAEN